MRKQACTDEICSQRKWEYRPTDDVVGRGEVTQSSTTSRAGRGQVCDAIEEGLDSGSPD